MCLGEQMTKTRTSKVLVWHNKHGEQYWDATGGEDKAFLAMFRAVKAEGYYYDIDDEGFKESKDDYERTRIEVAEIEAGIEKRIEILRKNDLLVLHAKKLDLVRAGELVSQRELFVEARKGDAKAARRLIMARSSYEYEAYSLEPLWKP
jgi:hypothetical protein